MCKSKAKKSLNDLRELELKQIALASFKDTAKSLKQAKIDTQYSGSTTCVLVVLDHHLVSCNLGDSRAMVFSMAEADYLTQD